MGTITTVVGIVGSQMAGAGACVVTEASVMGIGFAVTKSKVVRACVCCAAWGLGTYAWLKTERIFMEEYEIAADGVEKAVKKVANKIKGVDENVGTEA